MTRWGRPIKVFCVFGLIVIAGYAAAATRGWEVGAGRRGFVPADVRSSPGGYRSYHFWHGGYQGGK